jgi:hypothetical protein
VEQIIPFEVDGVELQVKADFDSIEKELDSLKWEDDYYTTLYSVNHADLTEEEFNADISYMRSTIHFLREHATMLEKHVQSLRKKKNKRFWSNSGTTIETMSKVSCYFTDFTNAWRVYQLRLEVVDEFTCELVLRQRTETI